MGIKADEYSGNQAYQSALVSLYHFSSIRRYHRNCGSPPLSQEINLGLDFIRSNAYFFMTNRKQWFGMKKRNRDKEARK